MTYAFFCFSVLAHSCPPVKDWGDWDRSVLEDATGQPGPSFENGELMPCDVAGTILQMLYDFQHPHENWLLKMLNCFQHLLEIAGSFGVLCCVTPACRCSMVFSIPKRLGVVRCRVMWDTMAADAR